MKMNFNINLHIPLYILTFFFTYILAVSVPSYKRLKVSNKLSTRNVNDCFSMQVLDASTLSSPLVDTERALAMLIGVYASCQARGQPVTPRELDHEKWISAEFMRAGCQVKCLNFLEAFCYSTGSRL